MEGPPEPPPPPPPYVLSVGDGQTEDAAIDALTAEALQRIQLTHMPRVEKPKEKSLDALSQLELAVKRRAAKQLDPQLLERGKEMARRLKEIRYERSLAEQAALVKEARELELELERGGPDAVKMADFPTYDLARMHQLVQSDLDVHQMIISAKKLTGGAAEGGGGGGPINMPVTYGGQQQATEKTCMAAEHLIGQLVGVGNMLEAMRRTNVEEYGLRLRIDAQEEGRRKYVALLLTMLYEQGLMRIEETSNLSSSANGSTRGLSIRAKFGSQYAAGKGMAMLKTALRMFKKHQVFIRTLEQETQAMLSRLHEKAEEVMSRSASSENGSQPPSLARSSSSGSMGASSSSNLAVSSTSSVEELLSSAETIASLSEEELEGQDILGNTPFHHAAFMGSVSAMEAFLKRPDGGVPGLRVRNKSEGDTPLSILCKRGTALRKERALVNVLINMVKAYPSALHEQDSFGRKPLATLALKLSLQSGSGKSANVEADADNSRPQQAPVVSFDRYLFSPALSDVTFVLDSGDSIPAHRIVLSAQSPVLRAMLEEGTFEEGKLGRVQLHEVDLESLQSVFRFLYAGAGHVSVHLHQEAAALRVLQLADQWLLYGLVAIIVRMLRKQLSRENCFMLMEALEGIQCCKEEVSRLRADAARLCLREYSDTLIEHDPDYSWLNMSIQILL